LNRHPFLAPFIQSLTVLFLLFLLSVNLGVGSILPSNALTTIAISTVLTSPSIGFFIARTKDIKLIQEFFKLGGTLVARAVPAGIGLISGLALNLEPLIGASELCILFAWIGWMWGLMRTMADYYKREMKV